MELKRDSRKDGADDVDSINRTFMELKPSLRM